MPSDNNGEGFVTYRALTQALANSERRLNAHLEDRITTMVKTEVDNALDARLLTEDERQWVKLAVHAQAQKVALRQAIIDKTLTALVWATIVGLGTFVWNVGVEWAKAHGYKP